MTADARALAANFDFERLTPRSASYERWLETTPVPVGSWGQSLRMRLGQTPGMPQLSETAEQDEANIERVFGSQDDLFR